MIEKFINIVQISRTMAEKSILLLKGDGSAPEASAEAIKVLNDGIGPKYGHKFEVTQAPCGAEAYLRTGKVVPDETRRLIEEYSNNGGGILKEAVGLDASGAEKLRQEGIKLEKEGVIDIRIMLDTFMAYRPAILTPGMFRISPIRPERLGEGLDILMLRELVGGIYVDDPDGGPMKKKIYGKDTNWEYAFDPCLYTKEEVTRFARACLQEARERDKSFTMVQKPNVLATGAFFEYWFKKIASEEFSDIAYKTKIIDAACADLVMNPTNFNGTNGGENLQYDIATDLLMGVGGTLALGAAFCWNPITKKGFFEATHGSAPDLKGKGLVNPYSMIGSAAMMLQRVFGMTKEAEDIWRSLNKVIEEGYSTRDIHRRLKPVEKGARANDDLGRLYTAFEAANPQAGLSREKVRDLILQANERYDADLEARVVSTSQFGDLVVKEILGRN